MFFRRRAPTARTRVSAGSDALNEMPILIEENSDIGADLASGIPYMDLDSASRTINAINHWRMMPREDFFASSERL
jgi:hypothetical protein